MSSANRWPTRVYSFDSRSRPLWHANSAEGEVRKFRPDVLIRYDFKTEILAASLRHPLHVAEAAMYGADIATISYDVIAKLLNHPLTDIGLKRFLDDWAKLKTK